MMKHIRQILAVTKASAAPLGIAVHIEHGGKHYLLALEGRGRRRILPVPSSPRCEGATVKNAIRDARRVIWEMTA